MNDDAVYRQLQKHLDRQPVGFPPSRTGSDIRLLKHHFTSEEARVALKMSCKYETAEMIFNRMKSQSPSNIEMNLIQLRNILESMCMKISIMGKENNGTAYYCLMPLVIGMYEGKVFNLDKNYINDFDEYANSLQHGLSLISTSLPQMRTIPVNKSVQSSVQLMPFDNLVSVIENHTGRIAIIECICRKKKSLMNEPCTQTTRTETCMTFGDITDHLLKYNHGREIHPEEALNILSSNQKEGLIFQASNMINPEVICSCCGCCCGLLGIQMQLPNPSGFNASNFTAIVEKDVCTGCGLCVNRCQMKAITLHKKKKPVTVNSKKCLGCGQCVTACRVEAIRLIPKKNQLTPPDSSEDLQDKIMNRKPWWRFGRILLRTLFRF
jgi:Na+-translocating ferredoxin:NAD+ oxidoreductase RNF subunit RnfB